MGGGVPSAPSPVPWLQCPMSRSRSRHTVVYTTREYYSLSFASIGPFFRGPFSSVHVRDRVCAVSECVSLGLRVCPCALLVLVESQNFPDFL
jgi:hypothetical protein